MIFLASLFLINACSSNSQTITVDNKNLTSGENSTSNDLNKEALTKLYKLILEKNQNAELKNDEIIINNSKIKVLVVPEQELKRDGDWIYAARFDVNLINSKETQFIVGSVGIGNNQKDAVATAIDEWIGLFGTAFSQMFASSKNKLTIENFKVYPGLMGIRGEKPSQNWIDGSPEMSKKIINALLPIIKKSNEEIISINLLFTADKTGITSGECKINNEASQEVIEALKKLDWKSTSGLYMFKQYFLLEKATK